MRDDPALTDAAIDAAAFRAAFEEVFGHAPSRGQGRPDEGEEDDDAELARHNAAYDRWERMTPAEREIQDAVRMA